LFGFIQVCDVDEAWAQVSVGVLTVIDEEEPLSWTILTVSLLPFWALKVAMTLQSLEGQKALIFHQKDLHLCCED
jgi:hypothetical protein